MGKPINPARTSYVDNDTLTKGAVSGTLHHSNFDVSGAYPKGYTWSYDGTPAGDTGTERVGVTRTIAFTTTKMLVNPITITPYHVNADDAEWSPDSCSGLHSESDG